MSEDPGIPYSKYGEFYEKYENNKEYVDLIRNSDNSELKDLKNKLQIMLDDKEGKYKEHEYTAMHLEFKRMLEFEMLRHQTRDIGKLKLESKTRMDQALSDYVSRYGSQVRKNQTMWTELKSIFRDIENTNREMKRAAHDTERLESVSRSSEVCARALTAGDLRSEDDKMHACEVEWPEMLRAAHDMCQTNTSTCPDAVQVNKDHQTVSMACTSVHGKCLGKDAEDLLWYRSHPNPSIPSLSPPLLVIVSMRNGDKMEHHAMLRSIQDICYETQKDDEYITYKMIREKGTNSREEDKTFPIIADGVSTESIIRITLKPEASWVKHRRLTKDEIKEISTHHTMFPLEEMAVNIGPIEHSSNDTTHTLEKHTLIVDKNVHTLIVDKNVQIDRIPLQYQYTHNRECKKGSPRYEPVVTDVLGRDERVATESLLRECRDNIENPMQRKLVTDKIMGKVNSEVVQQCIKYRNKQYASVSHDVRDAWGRHRSL